MALPSEVEIVADNDSAQAATEYSLMPVAVAVKANGFAHGTFSSQEMRHPQPIIPLALFYHNLGAAVALKSESSLIAKAVQEE